MSRVLAAHLTADVNARRQLALHHLFCQAWQGLRPLARQPRQAIWAVRL